MANHKSAEKAYRQSVKKNYRNNAGRSKLRTAIKDVRVKAAANNTTEIKASFVTAQKLLDRAATKGLIKAGNAARLKSRLNRLVKKIVTAKSA
jgi:small subunit ribosomal protein S20